MKDVKQFLDEARTFYVATVDNGEPRVRPIGATCLFEDKLYFIFNNRKEIFAQLMNNPNVEISAMTPDIRWIRLRGKLVRDERREAKAAMLEANPNLRAMYNEDDGLMEVFYLTDGTVSLNSFTAPPVLRTL